MEKFTSVEKEDIVDILQEIIDLNYGIFFRTVDKGIFIYKYSGHDDEYNSDISAKIELEEIYDPLGEAIDRLRDEYEVKVNFANALTDREIKYNDVPDSIDFPCTSITLILSPKSKFNRIKNFLNF